MEDADRRANAICAAVKLLSDDPAKCEKLTPALMRAADTIRAAQAEAESSPTRATARQKLYDLGKAAQTIARLLNDPDLIWLREHAFSPKSNRRDWKNISDRTSALADEAISYRNRIPANRGSHSLADMLGIARGRHQCAVAAVKFFELVGHRRPGKKNTRAQEFCAHLWTAAGGGVSDAVERGETADTGAWERHIAAVRDPAHVASSLSARLEIDNIIDEARLRDAFPRRRSS
jgi:hypothetical protein